MESDALSSFGLNIEIVQTIKLLGVIISSDLSWNAHVDYICTKASKRLYPLRIRKRSGAPANDLIQKRALKIAFPKSSFAASLRNVGLLTLYQRRENQCLSFYKTN